MKKVLELVGALPGGVLQVKAEGHLKWGKTEGPTIGGRSMRKESF